MSSANVKSSSTAVTAGTTSQAVAAGPAAAAPTGGLVESMIPLVFIIIAFYFLVMRPQQKKEERSRALRDSIKKGDKIITAGGIIGDVHKVISEREVSLEIFEHVHMRILRASIVEILPKGAEVGSVNSGATDATELEKKALKRGAFRSKIK
jgi:preprotein translocase subunit YajC